MSTQNGIKTRTMLAHNLYVGLPIYLEGEYINVTRVGKGEYCGQEVIEVDFDWPENSQIKHAGFYMPGEKLEVHPSANLIYCL